MTDDELIRLRARTTWLRRAYGALHQDRAEYQELFELQQPLLMKTAWALKGSGATDLSDLPEVATELAAQRDRLERELTEVAIAGMGIEGRLHEIEDELQERKERCEELVAAAQRLVLAAKVWTRAHQGLSPPDVRQLAVDELADAIDAFDPLLSEATQLP